MRTVISLRFKSVPRNRRQRFKIILRLLAGIVVSALVWSLLSPARHSAHKATYWKDDDLFANIFPGVDENSSVPVQYSETRFNGFGSQFLRIIDAAAIAQAFHAQLDIIEGKYWNYGCAPFRGWSCYFKRKRVRAGSCKELTRWPIPSPACIRVSSAASMRRSAAFLSHTSNGTVTLSRQLANRLWVLNEETQPAVTHLLRESGILDLGGEYIGVHVRRGDKGKEVPGVPLRQYVQAVECIDGNLPVFLATDDGAVLAEMRVRLGDRMVIALADTETRTGHFQINVNQAYMKQNRESVTALLADVTSLKDAKWFISTFSSNFARMVHILRKASPNTSISLDDQWLPGVAWRTFGKTYCRSVDANEQYCECREQRQS